MAWIVIALYLLLTLTASQSCSQSCNVRCASCQLRVHGLNPNQMPFSAIPKSGIAELYTSDLDPSVHYGIEPYDWRGCSFSDRKVISQTWSDAFKLVRLLRPIDWNSQAAQEIWGHGLTSNCLVPEDVRLRIQKTLDTIMDLLEMRSLFAKKKLCLDPFSPRLQGPWLKIRCDRGADNDDGACDGVEIIPRLEAYTSSTKFGAEITFCSHFFRIKALDDVMQDAIVGRTDSSDLWSYQNRARVLLHELAHVVTLKNPVETRHAVEDVEAYLEHTDGVVGVIAYGPQMIKILAQQEPKGSRTQHNADSYAWFAIAKYVEGQIGV